MFSLSKLFKRRKRTPIEEFKGKLDLPRVVIDDIINTHNAENNPDVYKGNGNV